MSGKWIREEGKKGVLFWVFPLKENLAFQFLIRTILIEEQF